MTSTASRDFLPGPEMRPASRPPREARVRSLGSSRVRLDSPHPRSQEVTQTLDGRFPVEVPRVVPAVAAPEAIDITNADRLRSALLQAAADGHGTLVVDMTRTRFCDCAGLHVLMAAHRQARAEGRELLLVISSAAVLRLFALTGADRVIPYVTRLDEAPAQPPGVQTAERALNVTMADAGPGESWPGAAGRLAATRLEFEAQVRRFEQVRTRLQATIDQTRRGRPQREILHASAFARLQARLDSMPVIEQAKGILMAQQRCGPDEAFDLLRRASQRANVKVSVLAAQIVERVATPGCDGGVKPARPADKARIAGPRRSGDWRPRSA
jgi:anti-anti-sigma factor